MTDLVFRPLARLDLLEIWEWIAEHDPAAAGRLIDRLEETCELIAGQPKIGRARPDLGPKTRSLPSGSYLVIYDPLPDGAEVLRIVHGARDIPALFSSGD